MTAQHDIVIDASNLILGRMATIIARHLLQGHSVVILNAEKAVISGRRLNKIQEEKEKLKIGHPRKGPYFPRKPDRYVRRAIRGMLPRKKPKGKEAYRKLRVFMGTPPEFKNLPTETIIDAKAEKLRCPFVTVEELVKEVGRYPAGEQNV